jgi:hypothetical protein
MTGVLFAPIIVARPDLAQSGRRLDDSNSGSLISV